jgi:thromboxane-A synthase/cytochrome P450 family 3 subfamily A
MGAHLLLLGCLAGALLWLGFRPVLRWRLRKIPGPLALPFIGNLPAMLRSGIHVFGEECGQRYGPVVRCWNGCRPWIMVKDADLARRCLLRFHNRLPFPAVLTGEEHEVWGCVCVHAHVRSGGIWAVLAGTRC